MDSEVSKPIRLPWVRSLYYPSKNFFFFFHADSLERQQSERAYGKRKVEQLKRQQFHSLESQSMHYLCTGDDIKNK